MELKELVQQAPLHLGRHQLDHGGSLGSEFPGHMHGQALVNEAAQHGGLGLGAGQLEARVLEVDQRLAERLSVTRVVDRSLQHGFDRCGCADADHQPLLRQFVHQVGEAGVFLTEPVG